MFNGFLFVSVEWEVFLNCYSYIFGVIVFVCGLIFTVLFLNFDVDKKFGTIPFGSVPEGRSFLVV